MDRGWGVGGGQESNFSSSGLATGRGKPEKTPPAGIKGSEFRPLRCPPLLSKEPGLPQVTTAPSVQLEGSLRAPALGP